jgi:hypothetical protein
MPVGEKNGLWWNYHWDVLRDEGVLTLMFRATLMEKKSSSLVCVAAGGQAGGMCEV